MVKVKDFVDNELIKLKNEPSPDGIFHIFQFGSNPASTTYVKNKIKDAEKVGITTSLHKMPEWMPRSVVEKLIVKISKLESTIGMMIQFPVPKHLEGIEQLVPSYLDVDGLAENSLFNPCTPSGIIYFLKNGLNIDLDGKNVCIIGRGKLVGAPLARMMNEENATVTVCHSHTKNIEEHIRYADIIVCAVGKKDFLTKDTLKWCIRRPIVIDVGTNFDENGKLCGDCAKDLQDFKNLSYITPVPGGVGLLTRMELMRHCYGLDKKEK